MTDRIVDPGNLGSGRAVLRPGAKARKLPARELRSSSVPPADRRFHLLVGLDNALRTRFLRRRRIFGQRDKLKADRSEGA